MYYPIVIYIKNESKKLGKMGLFSMFEKKHFAKIRIISCKDLVNEKSLNLFVKEHTCPWVSCWLNGSNHIGKTGKKEHTCNPQFDEEFTFEFHNDDYLHIRVHHGFFYFKIKLEN